METGCISHGFSRFFSGNGEGIWIRLSRRRIHSVFDPHWRGRRLQRVSWQDWIKRVGYGKYTDIKLSLPSIEMRYPDVCKVVNNDGDYIVNEDCINSWMKFSTVSKTNNIPAYTRISSDTHHPTILMRFPESRSVRKYTNIYISDTGCNFRCVRIVDLDALVRNSHGDVERLFKNGLRDTFCIRSTRQDRSASQSNH